MQVHRLSEINSNHTSKRKAKSKRNAKSEKKISYYKERLKKRKKKVEGDIGKRDD